MGATLKRQLIISRTSSGFIVPLSGISMYTVTRLSCAWDVPEENRRRSLLSTTLVSRLVVKIMAAVCVKSSKME